MCIKFLHLGKVHQYKAILAFNRDESNSRPTLPLHFWEDLGIYGGKDDTPGAAANGTWLGVSKSGKFGALLNVHSKPSGLLFSPNKQPRGGLVSGYLAGETESTVYMKQILDEGKDFNYFNLILGSFTGKPKASVLDFVNKTIHPLEEGVNCISNRPPKANDERVNYGKCQFSSVIAALQNETSLEQKEIQEIVIDRLFSMLRDETFIENLEGGGSCDHIYNDPNITHAVGLGSVTVSSTVILVSEDNEVTYIECSNVGTRDIKVLKWTIE